MQKIGDITNTADGNGEFTNGNVAAGVAPTILPAEWFNSVQRELINALAAAGIKPSQSDDTQLAEAIRKIIQKSVPHASTTQSGTVQLSNAIYSDSQTEAATSYAVRQVFDSADARLLKKLNGEDIPDKPQFVKNLGLEVTIEKARRAVPDNRRINGKWLSTDITLDASDVDAVSASKGGTIQGDIRVSEGVYIGKQRPDLVLSSLGTAKSRVNLSLWGINNRPTVLECHDDTGSIFYAQRSPNGSVIFSVDGEILPSNYGNFDARYGNKNTASKSERWWKCGDSGIIEQWGVVYVPDDEYREFEFPIFFPNRCDALVATPIYTAAVTSTNVISCHVNVRTNARFGVGLSATFSDPALNRVFWRAVGY